MLKTSLNRIAVFGGDMRQVYLADILAEQGFEVRVYGLCKTCKNPRIQRASSKRLTSRDIRQVPFF